MVYKYDFLIIGSGVAGMSYALKVARVWRQLPTWKWITSTSTFKTR